MKLDLIEKKFEFIHNVLDTNAINFHLEEGYFSIQTCVYLEEDEQLNEPFFEWCDASNSQNGGLSEIEFFNKKLVIKFQQDSLFCEKYSEISIAMQEPIKYETVDFFCNSLFLGKFIKFSADFDKNQIAIQTQEREK